MTRIKRLIARARNAAGYILRGDFSGLRQRLSAMRDDGAVSAALAAPARLWGVIATPHTLFLADLIARRLRAHGWVADIMTEAPHRFRHDMYVVLCPQMFKRLPPGEKRVVYQLEQSVSSRWFTKRYLKILNRSRAVLEYAMGNMEYLAARGLAYPHIHYLPVGADPAYGGTAAQSEKRYDVLFYGDANSSPRRLALLGALRKHFDVHTCSEVFGADMISAIRKARCVINIHYYENALLEVPRIQECLSLGTPVVSESAQDQDDYPELSGVVRFFAQGSEQAMIEAVRRMLATTPPPEESALAKSVQRSSTRFAFLFDRFLIAHGFLPATHAYALDLPLSPASDRIVLSLPETIARRRVYEANSPQNYAVFDGIRMRPGWVGCALSYSVLARRALQQGMSRLTVMEDDALLPTDFPEKMRIVNTYLDRHAGQWDIFVGIVAHLHEDAQILKTETFRGIQFVTIDKMTSMVCNIYGKKALVLLASWNPRDRCDRCNTIDRYLERQANLRIVVTLPFLVGHREDLHSTIWGFQNTRYRSLIDSSEATLEAKVREAWRARSGPNIVGSAFLGDRRGSSSPTRSPRSSGAPARPPGRREPDLPRSTP